MKVILLSRSLILSALYLDSINGSVSIPRLTIFHSQLEVINEVILLPYPS